MTVGIDRFKQRGPGSVQPEEAQAGGYGAGPKQPGNALSPPPASSEALSPIREARSLGAWEDVCMERAMTNCIIQGLPLAR